MPEETSKKKIIHNYIKNNDFKTSFSSAIYGGVTPNGLININFCIDRGAIPTRTESGFEDADGKKKLVIKSKDGRDGLVREVQFGTIIDVNMAKLLVEWLNGNIQKVTELQNQTKHK
jgi:hypothetical protein